MAQRQHDGADHRYQQHHARDLEVMDVLRIEHQPERFGVADIGRNRSRDRFGGAWVDHPEANDQKQFKEEYSANHNTDRQIFQKTRAQFGEIDIQHHDDEQEQRRDCADIYENENHPQEFGAHQHEQAGRVDERQDQKQHGMHGITRHNHHDSRGHTDAGEQIKEQRGKDHALTSPVRRVEFDRFRKLALPAVAIGEQFLLVIIEFLARLSGEFEIRSLDDGIDRTSLLAQAAINALHHVDVVADGTAGAVVAARPGLDGDRLRPADRLAQFAGNAALLAVGISAQGMLAAEARRDLALLERIIQRRLRLEEIAHGEKERRHEF